MSEVRLIPFVMEEVLQSAKEEIPYGVEMINAPAFWKEGEKGGTVVVAVLDTGCDINHPELKDRIAGGRNFVDSNPDDYTDAHYHGTHVAGTIAATLNEAGVAGVAPEVKLLICRVLGKDGSGSYQGIIDAIDYAVKWRGENDERVRVISMSLGGPEDVPELHESIQRAVLEDVLVVCAAGNEGDNKENTDEFAYPGAYKEVVEVGAVDEKMKLAPFSNTNDEIDLVAPGVNVISTYPGNKYAKLSGTSMATPHVSGAAALLIAREEKLFERKLTEAEVYAQLVKNTLSIGLTKKAEGNGLLVLNAQEKAVCDQETFRVMRTPVETAASIESDS
ncbi:S8 family peptidase [Fictibacillus barbaricus]|uniref:Major intracellular serine protease n=1 Tax=Fictibacillus barbaricus TaxID=182136 RepID=A0ABU1TX25_9BACL|nr:S8 family peptidase [Fictibacillus barbaricus]MDR7071767.1 major intracellular serine protease [Fictibacillus barbaricus]